MHRPGRRYKIHIPDQQSDGLSRDNRRALPQPVERGTVLQVDKAAPQNQKVLGYIGECDRHPNLLCHNYLLPCSDSTIHETLQILGISQSKAYQIMRKINRELEAEGYETIAGRVPRRRFCEKFYCGDELLDQPPRQTKERREHNGKTKATRKAAGQ